MSQPQLTNHIIMLARGVMGNVSISELGEDTLVTQFGRRHWVVVKGAVSVMSDSKRLEIVQAAVTSEQPDKTTTPHRITAWSNVNPIVTCGLQNKSGPEIVSDIATAVVIATIWDILNAQKRKE